MIYSSSSSRACIITSLARAPLLHLGHLLHLTLCCATSRAHSSLPLVCLPWCALHFSSNLWLLAAHTGLVRLRFKSFGTLRLLDILFKLFVFLLTHLIDLVFRVLCESLQHLLRKLSGLLRLSRENPFDVFQPQFVERVISALAGTLRLINPRQLVLPCPNVESLRGVNLHIAGSGQIK